MWIGLVFEFGLAPAAAVMVVVGGFSIRRCFCISCSFEPHRLDRFPKILVSSIVANALWNRPNSAVILFISLGSAEVKMCWKNAIRFSLAPRTNFSAYLYIETETESECKSRALGLKEESDFGLAPHSETATDQKLIRLDFASFHSVIVYVYHDHICTFTKPMSYDSYLLMSNCR